jgi:hypothetical protein
MVLTPHSKTTFCAKAEIPYVLPSLWLKKTNKDPTISSLLPLHPNRLVAHALSLRRQVTCKWAQRAPLGLKGDGLHAAVPEAVP